MEHNKLFYFQQIIKGNADKEVILKQLYTVMDEIESIYSYTIHVDRKEETNYIVRYRVSEKSKYNTLSKNDVVFGILNTIENDRINNGKYIIGHMQPPIDVLIELYEPLVNKLSAEQHRRWQVLEYEDLCQICRMVIVILYNRGYYIHKNLIEKAFNNAVLQEMRIFSNEVSVVSLETQIEGEDMEKLKLQDTLSDMYEICKEQDQDEKEQNNRIFNEVREILVDMIGERQFEQLYRDYTKGHTTTWSRRKMQSIKTKLNSEGLNRQKFNNKYGR